jgi:hypothetical protein
VIAELKSQTGVKQGDPFAALGFSITIQPELQEAAELAKGGEVVAVLDDITVAGPTAAVQAACQYLDMALPPLGLQSNLPKRQILVSPDLPADSGMHALAAARGIALSHGAIEHLGGVIGIGAPRIEAARQEVAKARARFTKFGEALTHPAMSRQVGLHLLRMCGVPRFHYLARVLPPSAVRDLFAAVDADVQGLLRQMLEIHDVLPGVASYQNFLPIRDGGLGLRSMTVVSDAGYYAAAAEAAASIAKALQHVAAPRPAAAEEPVEPVQLPPGVLAELSLAHQRLVDNGVPADGDILPALAADTLQVYSELGSSKLQRLFVKTIEKRLSSAMAEAMREDRQATARINSSRGNLSSTLLTALPSLPAHRLNDADMQFAVRLRLGLQLKDQLQGRCVCGVDIGGADRAHFLSCHAKGIWGMAVKRHHCLRDAFHAFCVEAGLLAEIEPPLAGCQQRPDLYVRLPNGEECYMDFAVVHPTAPSHLISTEPLAATRKAESRKDKKYLQLARASGATFTPFVVETLGAFGSRALAFVQKLAHQIAEARQVDDQQELYRSLHARLAALVAMQVHRGNSSMIRAGLQRATLGRPVRV